MGDPRKQKRKFEKPLRPWDRQRMETENKIKNKFGLKRKQEIWKSQSFLRNIRRQARELAAVEDKDRQDNLLNKAEKLGLIGKNPELDDILELDLEDILNRRLQTLVYKKGFANTPKQARQFIVHGHVNVGNKKIEYPSFLVPNNLENEIKVDDKVLNNE